MKITTTTRPAWNVFGVEALPEERTTILEFTAAERKALKRAQDILEAAESKCLNHFRQSQGSVGRLDSLPDYGADDLDDLLAMGAARIRELLEWANGKIILEQVQVKTGV